MIYRGVLLAGGKGTRLGDLTRVTNKHLLPVGAEPMILHALRKLTGAGIRDILLISGPEALGAFIKLLGSGQAFGADLTFRAQDQPGGIAQALALAEDFVGQRRCVVLLGDNIFGDSLATLLQRDTDSGAALVVLKHVANPTSYGVAEVRDGRILGIEEKPRHPRSDYAIAGIYLYPPDVFDIIRTLKPSGRGELEITDVNNAYLNQGRLRHGRLDGYWTDAGTFESLALANRLASESPPVF